MMAATDENILICGIIIWMAIDYLINYYVYLGMQCWNSWNVERSLGASYSRRCRLAEDS